MRSVFYSESTTQEKMRSIFYSESIPRKKCEAYYFILRVFPKKNAKRFFQGTELIYKRSSHLSFLYILDYCFNSVFETVICFKLGFDLSYGVMNG